MVLRDIADGSVQKSSRFRGARQGIAGDSEALRG
jgi:hypothetical protein